MTPDEAIEFTLAALADMPSGPPAHEILAVIQTAAKIEALEDAAEWLKQPSESRGGFAYWWLHEKADAYRKGRLK